MRYLGVFVGDEKSKCEFLKDCTKTWERNIHTVRETAGKYPQESYAAVVCAILLQWMFI